MGKGIHECAHCQKCNDGEACEEAKLEECVHQVRERELNSTGQYEIAYELLDRMIEEASDLTEQIRQKRLDTESQRIRAVKLHHK